MSKKVLLIVESPAKSNTITKYLGSQYLVRSSMGHIRDLSKHILSIDIKNNYNPHYEIVSSKTAIVAELKKAAKRVDAILLATDPDREGEAIAFHLKEILKSENNNIRRVLFNEVTSEAINKAVKSPTDIDYNKVNSQQMRRLLDRLAGYKISPVLQKKMGGPLSAGRVQSVALNLIVKREKEIQAFDPVEYWTIDVDLAGSKKPDFNAKLEKSQGKIIQIPDEKSKNEILSKLQENAYILHRIEKKIKKKRPLPPLITSTLQQEAYQKLNFSVKKTMRIAQQLYEGIDLGTKGTSGLITYMRTDSYRISQQAQNAAREYIHKKWGEKYVPDKFNFFSRKAKSQDAHEAIRPVLPYRDPQEIKNHLNSFQFKLYRLIWHRFFASQMKEAILEHTVFDIMNGSYLFTVKGEIIKFDGYMQVLNTKSGEEQLPDLKEKETLTSKKLNHKQNFTKPPSRYTEASLVKTLEKNGIGRPSTYASIIDIISKRDYVCQEEKKFLPTFLGIKVAEYLDEHFNDIIELGFTAKLEEQLDKVSEGVLEWVKGIDDFYKKLSIDLENVESKGKVLLSVGRKCLKCDKELALKYSFKTKGWFVGCSGYPSCNYIERSNGENDKTAKEVDIEKNCPKCRQKLVKRYSSKTRDYFIGCSGFPKCKYTEPVKEDLGTCPNCKKPLVKRFSRKIKRYFIACSGYPECKFIQKTNTNK